MSAMASRSSPGKPSSRDKTLLLKQALAEKNKPTVDQKRALLNAAVRTGMGETADAAHFAKALTLKSGSSSLASTPPSSPPRLPSSPRPSGGRITSGSASPEMQEGGRRLSALDTVDGTKSAFTVEKAKYLGAKSCDGQPTEENLQMAVKEMKRGKKSTNLTIHLDPTTIRLVNAKTKEIIQSTELREMLCWNAYPKDKKDKFLVYMATSGDGRVEVTVCHVLIVKGEGIPVGLKMAIANLTSSTDFGTMKLPNGEIVPKPPPRLEDVAAAAAQRADLYTNSSWKFQCDVLYVGQAKSKDDPGPQASANVIKRIVAMSKKGRRGSAKKNTPVDKTCAPMNDMPITLAATERSLRLIDRTSGQKIDQVLLANIVFAHAEGGKDPFVGVLVKKKSQTTVKTIYIFKVPLRDGQPLVRELAIMAAQSESETTAEALHKSNPFAAPPNEPREAVHGALRKLQIHRSDLSAEKMLGSGQFGEVYLAFQSDGDGSNPTKRAVKMLKGSATRDAKKEFVRECDMMIEAGKHRNLVQMVGVALQQSPWLCVLEFLPYGDLQGLMQDLAANDIKLELGVMLDFCSQLCDGGAHLASKRLVHMDLAARNVLVGKNNLLKIADLGLTHSMCDEGSYYILPNRIPLALKWLSPETMDMLFFSESSDVWAMGVTFWEIFSYGQMPFRAVLNSNIFHHLKSGNRLGQPPSTPLAVWQVIETCWYDEMERRPSFKILGKKLKTFLREYPSFDDTQLDVGKLVNE